MNSRCVRLIGALAFPLLTGAAQAQATDVRPSTPEVRTSATVQRSVRPNLATVTLNITATAGSARAAGERLALRVDSLRRALGGIGILSDSIVTGSRWYWFPNRVDVVINAPRCVPLEVPALDGSRCVMKQDTTYTARENITARIHDISRVGAVIDSAFARRITEITGPQFSATDISAAQEDALREATLRARRQAEAMASAAGAQLGRLLSLSTYTTSVDPYRYAFSDASSMSSDAAPGTTIVAPSVPVSMTVYGRWELVTRP